MGKTQTEESKSESPDCSEAWGMTIPEQVALNHLVKFWNSFVALPSEGQENSDTKKTVCDAVHVIQGILAIRVARRVNPEIWR